VTTLIGRLFHVSYTIEGTWLLLKRHSCSCQQPARRAIERDDAVVELWRKAVWPRVKAPRRLAGPGRLRGRGRTVDDAASRQDLGPHRARARRPCARTGIRPGSDGGAGLIQAGRAVSADLPDPRVLGPQDEPKGFARRDFRCLIVRARIQLGGPIVDDVRLHLTAGMKDFISALLPRLRDER
jgi:hypothetical protein